MATKANKSVGSGEIDNGGGEGGFIQWSDNTFEKIYWRPLARYKRPNAAQLTDAVKYFLQHYANGTGTAKHWQEALRILLLGLRVIDSTDDSKISYILANEDVNKTEEKPLPFTADVSADLTVSDYKVQKWFEWCLKQLNNGQNQELATYFGCISLFLCKLIVWNAESFTAACGDITKVSKKHFHVDCPTTPLPNRQLYSILKEVFVHHSPFSNEIVIRLARRRIEIQPAEKELQPAIYSKILNIQNTTCYNAFADNDISLLSWYFAARKVLNISNAQFLDMLRCLGEFEHTIEIISKVLPKVTEKKESMNTWSICRMLRRKAFPEWSTKYNANKLAAATFTAISRNITDPNDSIWNSCQFKNIKNEAQCIEKGISIAQSIKRAVEFDKKNRQLKN